MKKKRMLALVLAILFAFTILMPTAITASGPYTLQINGNVDNYLFEAFHLMDVDEYGYYTAVSPFDEMPLNGLAGFTIGDTLEGYIRKLSPGSGEFHDFMVAVNNFIVARNDPTPEIAPVATSTNGTTSGATINGITPAGYYFIAAFDNLGLGAFSPGESFMLTINDMTTTSGTLTVLPKVGIPQIEKEIVGGDDPKWTNAAIGDTITFELTITIPDLDKFQSIPGFNYTLNVHDTLSAGLTLMAYDDFDFTISVNSALVTSSDVIDDITVSNLSSNRTGLVIELNSDYILGLNTGDIIKIQYDAELNENAVVGAPGNKNSVHLEYSNDPFDEGSTGHTHEEETTVYTFGFEIFKFERVTNSSIQTPLYGATFQLYDAPPGGPAIPYMFVRAEVGSDTLPDIYRLATPSDSTVTQEFRPSLSGYLQLTGLDVGTYYLEETVAPPGFAKLSDYIVVTISHTDGSGNYTVSVNGTPLGHTQVNVENNRGDLLPETGGIGRTILYTVGGLIMGTAILMFVFRKKLIKTAG